MITERSYSTDHPTAGFWPRQLTAASLLPLEPRLKGNQPWCLACKCLTINQHHKNPLDPDAARALSPSVLTCTSFFFTSRIPLVPFLPPTPSPPYSLSSLSVEYAGHMPLCHSPFLFSNLPYSSVTAINQPLTPWRQGPLGGVHQAQREYAWALRALPSNRAVITSPTPRQRLGSKD